MSGFAFLYAFKLQLFPTILQSFLDAHVSGTWVTGFSMVAMENFMFMRFIGLEDAIRETFVEIFTENHPDWTSEDIQTSSRDAGFAVEVVICQPWLGVAEWIIVGSVFIFLGY